MRTQDRLGAGCRGSGYWRSCAHGCRLLLLVAPLPLALVSRSRAAAGAVPGAAAGLPAVGVVHPQTAAEVIPAPVPDAENAAPLYLEALAVIEAEDVWGSNLAELAAAVYDALYAPGAHRNLIVQLEGFRVAEAGNRQPSVAEASEEFSRRLDTPAVARAMGLVENAVAMPRCRFSIDYGNGAEAQLPHLARLRALSRFLMVVTVVVGGQGDAGTTWDCLAWSLGLADAVSSEPLLISQLVRIAQAGLALSALQTVTERIVPDAASAARLDALLARFDDREPLVRALEGERLLFGEWLLDQPPEKARDLLKGDGPAAEPDLTPEQLEAALGAYRESMLRLTELSRLPYPEAGPRIEAELAVATSATPVARVLLPGLGPYFRKVVEFEAQVRVARVGLRLKQHKAARGAYPAALAELDLAGLPATVSQDPFTAKPLAYRPAEAGFVLYSLGPDLADDGGAPRKGGAKAGYDVVWRASQ